jgi:hypothetical protein
VGDVVNLFRGPVARLYRRSLTDQGFEVLMAIACVRPERVSHCSGPHCEARSNVECPHRIAHQGWGSSLPRSSLRAVEIRMGEAKEHELPPEVAWSLLTQVLAESRLRTADSNLRRWLRLLQE